MKQYKSLAYAIVIVGALNWGLVGLMSLNLVSSILGVNSVLEKLVYIVVGASGLLLAWDKWGGAKK